MSWNFVCRDTDYSGREEKEIELERKSILLEIQEKDRYIVDSMLSAVEMATYGQKRDRNNAGK